MDTIDYIKQYNLKIDPEQPHHYIIGIAMHSLTNKNPGEIYLKYGPVYFTNDDIIGISQANQLTHDKLFPTTNSEALELYDKRNLASTLYALKFSANANNATLHHFSSPDIMDEEWFVEFIKTAHLETTQKLLNESRIRL